MATYARLGRRAVEGLARQFGLGEVTALSSINGGLENTSYCVETGSSRYVLTCWDQKSFELVSDLANLLVYLTSQGIHTSEVVVSPTGFNVVLHDEKPVMFKRYVEGQVTPNLSTNLLGQLGEEMARLHQIAAPAYLPNAFPYGRKHFFELTSSDFDHPFSAWLTEQETYLQAHIPQQLPMALIHGDLFFDNLIVQGDQLSAIIDFEEASHYYRIFDLGMALVGTCRDRNGLCFEKAGQLIRGYQQHTLLESIEQESLKTFAMYAATATSFWRFRQYHLRRPEPRHYDQHLEMQTLADTISGYPDACFTELFVT